MQTNAEALINELAEVPSMSGSAERNDRLSYNVYYVDSLDSDFSRAAKELVTTDSERERITARASLRAWLTDDKGVPAARNNVADMGTDIFTSHPVSNFILEYAIKDMALNRIRVGCDTRYDELHWSYSYHISGEGGLGDTIVQETGLIPRPDLRQASKDELDRYFHPVAVASKIIKISEDKDRFIRELPAFMEWVASAQDMDTALQNALAAKSITPSTIEALTAMRETTIAPLHNGLI